MINELIDIWGRSVLEQIVNDKSYQIQIVDRVFTPYQLGNEFEGGESTECLENWNKDMKSGDILISEKMGQMMKVGSGFVFLIAA